MQVSAVHASFPVILGGLFCCYLVFQGFLDSNLGVSVGPEEYAEKPDPQIYGERLIEDVKFPANAVVNVLYTAFGTYWVMRGLFVDQAVQSDVSHARPSRKLIDRLAADAFMTAVFGWMGVFYGPVQFLRIASQAHHWAVLDQWFTFPFFSWVFCWELYSIWPSVNKFWFLLVEFVSMSSYFLTLYSALAFDVVLGLHILLAVSGAVYLIRKHPERSLLTPFLCAIVCTCGFVFLKLGDHQLAELNPFFTILSGHFWSKICDAMQIHFVCKLFFNFNSYEYENVQKNDKKRK